MRYCSEVDVARLDRYLGDIIFMMAGPHEFILVRAWSVARLALYRVIRDSDAIP